MQGRRNISDTKKKRGGENQRNEEKEEKKYRRKEGEKITNELQIRHVEKYRLKKANSRK